MTHLKTADTAVAAVAALAENLYLDLYHVGGGGNLG